MERSGDRLPVPYPREEMIDQCGRSSGSNFAPPVHYTNEIRFMDPKAPHRVPDKRRVWGRDIEVLHGLPSPRPTDRSFVKVGVHGRLDVIAPDLPRYNPSLAAIDPSSDISHLAAFIGSVRVGLNTYRGPSFFQQADQPGDPKGGVDYRNGVILEASEHVSQVHKSWCEVLLLDRDFGVIAQTRVESSVQGLYEDCRVMYLHRGHKRKRQLYIYTTAYHGDLETRFPLPEPADCIGQGLRSTLRPLDLIVAYSDRGASRHNLFQAEYRAIEDPLSISLCDMVVWRGDNDSRPVKAQDVQRPLQGKNHVFFEDDEDGRLYIINRLVPLEVYKVVNDKSVERMPVVAQPAMQALSRFSLNGGKMVVMPELGSELLGLAHVHMKSDSRYYTQVFFTMPLKPPFRITRLSHEFCFSAIQRQNVGDWIQFPPCLERVGDVLIMPYGRQDLESMVLTMKMRDVMTMLRPLVDNDDAVYF